MATERRSCACIHVAGFLAWRSSEEYVHFQHVRNCPAPTPPRFRMWPMCSVRLGWVLFVVGCHLPHPPSAWRPSSMRNAIARSSALRMPRPLTTRSMGDGGLPSAMPSKILPGVIAKNRVYFDGLDNISLIILSFRFLFSPLCIFISSLR